MTVPERTNVEPIPEAQAPKSWHYTLKLIRHLREMFGDDRVIDAPEVRGEVVAFFTDEHDDAVIVTAVATVSDEEANQSGFNEEA